MNNFNDQIKAKCGSNIKDFSNPVLCVDHIHISLCRLQKHIYIFFYPASKQVSFTSLRCCDIFMCQSEQQTSDKKLLH
jgi:hypothetical protein